jgi:hypothetical protein
MRGALVGSIVAATCLVIGTGEPRAADPPPVTFAVLRGDGILIPFATRAGDRWTNAWPEPEKRVSVPVRIGDLPKRWWGKTEPTAAWHAWLIDGTLTLATVERPAWYPSLCRRGIGLQTNVTARPPFPPPETSPYPKLGIATTAPLPFQPVEVLDRGHPLRAPLTAALAKPVADGEARLYLEQHVGEEFRRTFDGPEFGSGRSSSHVRKSPRSLPGTLRVERVFRVPVGEGRSLFYFEAARRYPEGSQTTMLGQQPRPLPCEGMTFARGWFISDGAEVPVELPVNVQLATCEYEDVVVMLPLGYLATERGALLIVQFSSREREMYAVVRADRRRREPEMMLVTAGGGCTS